MNKYFYKKQKGITLIALVITIIVLLILAGVTIAAISGNEGVLDKAQSAKNKTEIANAKEAAALKATEYIQDYYHAKYITKTTDASTVGEYVAEQFGTQIQSGNYYMQAEGNSLKVSTDAAGTNIIAEGTIGTDGIIDWLDTTSGGNVTPIDPPPGPTVVNPTGITITNNSSKTIIQIGETLNLSAVITPDGAEGTIEWSCTPTGAVTFSSNTGNSVTVTGASVADVVITATIQGTSITSEEEMTVELTSAQKATKADTLNSKIGKQVNYTAPTTSGYTDTWRLFYADNQYVYLITTTDAGNFNLPGSTWPKNYSGSTDVFSAKNGGKRSYSGVKYGETYNALWKTALGTSINTNPNTKMTAYMCDPENWEQYVADTTPKGTYCVGGPTLELFIASWNKAIEKNISGKPSSSASLASGDVNANGYTANKPDAFYSSSAPYPITTSIVPITISGTSYGLYNPNGQYAQLASPCNYDLMNSFQDCCIIDKDGYIRYGGNYGGYNHNIRPLVCIPISTFNSNTIFE